MTTDQLGRALRLYRRTALSRSAIVLLVANAIPIVGVVFFGWSLLTILVLYWIENGIVGFWNVPKILLAQGRAAAGSPGAAVPPGSAGMAAMGTAMDRLGGVGRAGLAIFFSFHYGIFWLVHGIFVFALPAFDVGFGAGTADQGVPCGVPFGVPGSSGSVVDPFCSSGPFGDILWTNVFIAAIALFISHGASFLFNYIGRGEYIVQSPGRQMGSAYGRVVVLHVTIIVGAFVVAFLGAPIGALLVLVGLKTAFDLGLHLREHRTAGPPLPAQAAG
jgi:Family of unknown function (DUF6498)